MLVRKAGLEPAWLAPPPPQDGVSANSTTSAFKRQESTAKLRSIGRQTTLPLKRVPWHHKASDLSRRQCPPVAAERWPQITAPEED